MAESDPKRETNANGQPNPEDRLLNRLRLPAAGLLAFLLVVGAYYKVHYQQNAEYLANRNFRLLATLGKQVSDAVKNEGRVFSNVVGRAEASPRTARLGSSDGAYRLSFESQRAAAEKGSPASRGEVELQ